jgi:RNA polymerase sigma-70 factor (ECF subfamily)
MSPVIDNERFRKLLQSYPIRAIAQLYDFYHKSLESISLGLTRDLDASKDIVQEVFYSVWKNSDQLSNFHERSIEHYLVKAVRFKSITYYKKENQLNIEKLEFLNRAPLEPAQLPYEHKIIEAEIIAEIREVIGTFPKRTRQCFLMRVDREMTINQIAEELGISRKAVEKNLTSARKRVKSYLKSGIKKINP